jgi:hypothetical protein
MNKNDFYAVDRRDWLGRHLIWIGALMGLLFLRGGKALPEEILFALFVGWSVFMLAGFLLARFN